jgi:hypothetical protein
MMSMPTLKPRVDRACRNRLIGAIEKYLADKITAFEFDEQITQIVASTTDPAVQFVGRELWYHYDDCDDHLVRLTPEAWNYLQRLLLLLRSDYCVETHRSWVWLPTQVAAAITLAAFAMIAIDAVQNGFFSLAVIPLGVMSLILSAWKARLLSRRETSPYSAILFPFASFSELREVLEDSPKFQKRRYRPEIRDRACRGRLAETALWMQYLIGCCVLSPVAIAIQLLPASACTVNVVRGQPSASLDGSL